MVYLSKLIDGYYSMKCGELVGHVINEEYKLSKFVKKQYDLFDI